MKCSRRILAAAAFGATFSLAPPAAWAQAQQPVDVTPDIQGDINTNVANVGKQTVGDVLPEPFKSWNGLRPYLAERGLTFAFTYQSDTVGNLAGGARTGGAYIGRLQSTTEFDPEKLTGWKGGLFHASMYQIHGVGPSSHFVGSVDQVSDLEALATTRLGELWFEQTFNDKLSLRLGQLGVDTDFFLSQYYGIGIGSTFGWPTIVGVNLPNGGPAYPFASPGARLKFTPNDKFTFLAAIFDGDPAGPGTNNPQVRNRWGTNFRMKDPPFAIAEGQFKYGSQDSGPLLPGQLKLGAWQHFGRFTDQRFAIDGLAVSDPSSVGTAIQHRGNFGVYGVLEQQIYQKPDNKDSGIFAITRASFSPGDRNPIQFYVDAGLSFQGLVPGRPNDQFAFLGSFSKVSPGLRAADFDANFFNGKFAPVHNFGALVEATYAISVMNGVVLQPNIQYVFHPGGGGIADPRDPLGLRPQPNALVVGVRTTVQY
jgi:porin